MVNKWFHRTPVVKSLRVQTTKKTGEQSISDIPIQSGDELNLNVSFEVTIAGTVVKSVKHIKITVV